jgi:hypothetical protein
VCVFWFPQVILSGSVDSYALTGLRPSTEYEAMLTAVFKDKSESDAVAVMATTRKGHVPLFSHTFVSSSR